MLDKFENFFHSKKRVLGGLFVVALLLSLPFTLSQLSIQQDVRQRAAETDVVTQSGSNCVFAHPELDAEEQAMITLINNYRVANGLVPYQISEKLNEVSDVMAQDQAAHGYTEHIDSTGRDLATRLNDCSITRQSGGENVGIILNKPTQDLFNAWINSTGHRQNILGGDFPEAPQLKFTSMGIARERTPDGSYTWVNDFANPNPDGNSSEISNSPTVTASPTPFATSTPLPTNPAGGTNITVSVLISGVGPNASVGENPNPVVSQKLGQIKLIPQNGQETLISATFNFDNATKKWVATVGQLSPIESLVKLRLNNTLWEDAGPVLLTTNQNSVVPIVSLVSGDVNQDNVLDLLDYNIFISCFGNKECGQKQISDLNLDGKVNEIDLNIFYSGLATRNGD